MSKKIGVVTTAFGNFTTKETFKTEQALEVISKAGFKYVELTTMPGYFEHLLIDKNDIYKPLKLSKEYNIEISTIAAPLRIMNNNTVEDVEGFKKIIDIASLLNVKYLTTGPGEAKNDEDLKRFYKEISILGEYAEEKDIYICLETCGSFFNNGKTASEIVKKINMKNVRINYDTANVITFGSAVPEEDIKYVLPFLAHMHLKDRINSSGVSDSPAVGAGIVNFEKIFTIVEDFQIPMSVEIEFMSNDKEIPKLEDVYLMLKESHDFLKNLGIL